MTPTKNNDSRDAIFPLCPLDLFFKSFPIRNVIKVGVLKTLDWCILYLPPLYIVILSVESIATGIEGHASRETTSWQGGSPIQLARSSKISFLMCFECREKTGKRNVEKIRLR